MNKKSMTHSLVNPVQLLSGVLLFRQLVKKKSSDFIPVQPMEVQVTTFAGNTHTGFNESRGGFARFTLPAGIATDAWGNVYVVDYNSHRICKITSAGTVTTLAGSGTAGFADGTGVAAQFNFPTDIAADISGNIYVADAHNHCIRKITPAGVVSTLAGNGIAGFAEGTGISAKFWYPSGVATDGSGNIYVADRDNHRIRKVTPKGEVNTLAGNGDPGFAEGAAPIAQFKYPIGIATDVSGNVYIADCCNHRIRKITPAGTVSTLAGSGMAGFASGIGTTAQFNFPTGVATDVSGNVYVADKLNNRVRKITGAGDVRTVAGSGLPGLVNGTDNSARFSHPYSLSVDAAGAIYVADVGNKCIRKIKYRI